MKFDVLIMVKVMNFYKFFLIILCVGGLNTISAQDSLVVKSIGQYPKEMIQKDEFGKEFVYDEKQKAKVYEINGETVVVLDELILVNKPRFNNQLDQNYYYFLNKKLNRVYPLFVTALEQYQDLQKEIANVKKEDRKTFARERQNLLADEYEAKLRNLTTSEGQIFAKLMYRATDKTVFEIIKDLRGNWSAFWWNVKGNIADVDIKAPYDPHRDRVDEYVESLLQSNWNAGYLQPYYGYQNFKVKK